MGRPVTAVEIRFWSKVAKRGHDECWEWKSGTKVGYGQFWDGEYCDYAHRTSWLLHYGKRPESGLFVCHTCDNRLCVNPAHLFLGTCAENHADRNSKGRQARGSRHGRALLREEDVSAIRLLIGQKTQNEIARQYGVSRSAIVHIIRGDNWKHLP